MPPAEVIILVLICIYVTSGASLSTSKLLPPEKEEGRIFWSPLATVLESTSFLPITINIPDLFYGLGDLVGGAFNYVFDSNDSNDDPSVPRIFEELLREITA